MWIKYVYVIQSSDRPTSDDNHSDDWLPLDMEHSIPTAGITNTTTTTTTTTTTEDLTLPLHRSTCGQIHTPP